MGKYNMSDLEQQVRDALVEFMINDGYPRFGTFISNMSLALLLNKDDFVRLGIDPARRFAAAVNSEDNLLILNNNVPTEDLSWLIRHECFHPFCKHMERFKKYMMEKYNIKSAYLTPAMFEASNYAGDWDLSRFAYTDDEAERVHGANPASQFILEGKVFAGLVLEYDHPDWMGLTFEEILEKTLAEHGLAQQIAQVQDWQNKFGGRTIKVKVDQTPLPPMPPQPPEKHSPDFISGYEQAIKDYLDGKIDTTGWSILK